MTDIKRKLEKAEDKMHEKKGEIKTRMEHMKEQAENRSSNEE